MSVAMILLPLFVEVGLTFLLLFRLGALRVGAVKAGTAGPEAAVDSRAYPLPCQQNANAFGNQFELPVLFYVLTALALVTRKADIVFVVLAWLFVLSRIAHAFVHVTSNALRTRFGLFAAGAVLLLVMWVLFALAILLNL